MSKIEHAVERKTIWIRLTRLPETFASCLLRVGLCGLLVAAVLLLLMGAATYRLAGLGGLVALLAALGIALLSNFCGSVPACWSLTQAEPVKPANLLWGIALRLVLLVLLSASVLLADLVPVKPLLVCLAISYFVFLMIETLLLANWLNQHRVRGTK